MKKIFAAALAIGLACCTLATPAFARHHHHKKHHKTHHSKHHHHQAAAEAPAEKPAK